MKKYIYALSLLFLVSCGSGRKNPFKNADEVYRNNPKEVLIDIHKVSEEWGDVAVGEVDHQKVEVYVDGVLTSYKEIKDGEILKNIEYDISYDKNGYLEKHIYHLKEINTLTRHNDSDEIVYDTVKQNRIVKDFYSYNEDYSEAIRFFSSDYNKSIKDSIISEKIEQDTMLVKYNYKDNTITYLNKDTKVGEYAQKRVYNKDGSFNYVVWQNAYTESIDQIFYNKNDFIERIEQSNIERDKEKNKVDTLFLYKTSYKYYDYDKHGNPLKVLEYENGEPKQFKIYRYKY